MAKGLIEAMAPFMKGAKGKKSGGANPFAKAGKSDKANPFAKGGKSPASSGKSHLPPLPKKQDKGGMKQTGMPGC